ncbi:MAG TPA: hypothetical protein VGE81_05305 [Candidatus Limnocylindrales bacterium]
MPEPTSSSTGRTGPSREATGAEGIPESDEKALISLIDALERELAREDLPHSLRTRGAAGLERMKELLDAVRADNAQLVHELIEGTVRENGTKRPDGLAQILPLWARGTATLDALRGIVVVDDDQHPVTVTVHWELVPPTHRRAAASLASALVDAYRDRPRGGRPSKSQE